MRQRLRLNTSWWQLLRQHTAQLNHSVVMHSVCVGRELAKCPEDVLVAATLALEHEAAEAFHSDGEPVDEAR